jgi:hypothetical protein
MEIRIIDNSGVRMNFEFDYRHVSPKLDFNEILIEIKKSFKLQLEKVSSLFSSDDIFFHVNLELSSDYGENILGLFDAHQSSNTIFYFRIYQNTIRQLIEKQIYNNEAFLEYEDTILHEIIHAADYVIISKTDTIEATNKKVRSFEDTALKSNENLNKNPFNWTAVNIIERFRNEGIAVLGEKLLGNNPDVLYNYDVEHITNQFKHVLEFCIKTSESIDLIYSLSEKNELYAVLDKSSGEAYIYGHIILLLIIALQHDDKKEICMDAVDYFLGNLEKKPTKEKSLEILKIAITTDLSDYINGLLIEPFHHYNSSIIDKQVILNFCAHIQGESNTDAIKILTENTFNTVYDKFINLMQITVGYRMTLEEIVDYSKSFVITKDSDEIKNCIKDQMNYLLPLAIEEQNEIAIWALTYLFDEEELIYDSIPFFGYQDDWLVLNAAIRLIKTSKNNNHGLLQN